MQIDGWVFSCSNSALYCLPQSTYFWDTLYVSCKSIWSHQNSYRITMRILIGKTDGFASKCDSKIDSQWLREIIWFFLNCFFYPMWSKLWLNCGWEWPLLSKMLKLAVDTETGLGVTWFWLFLSCLVLFFFLLIIKLSRL